MSKIILTQRTRRFIGIAAVMLLLTLGAVALVRGSNGGSRALPESTDINAVALPMPEINQIAKDYGGLSTNREQQALVSRVGGHLVSSSDAAKSGYSFRFYVLADQNRINVFAMPDGTIFITTLMFNHLTTEGQLASMLAHEIGQVMAATRPYYREPGIVAFPRERESKADANAVRILSQAGYDPTALITTLTKLSDINNDVAVEFFLSHPSPVNRLSHIEYAIKQQFPDGVPESLSD